MKQHPLVRSVEKTLLEFRMLQSRDKVLVAVSGGPDSVALLHILLTLKTAFDIQLGVAHLDHGLRPSAAARDAEFVSSLAKKAGLTSHAAKTDIRELHQHAGGSLESLGRKARYDFFSRVAKKFGYNKIALGHHADDNAELVLMNLFRGSGPLGLSGIPPTRENRYIRPLIEQPRRHIMTYLQDNQMAFVLDETNNDQRFLRNRIRHELMPRLTHDYNPKLVDTLNRTAAIMRAEQDLLNQYANRLFNTLAHMDGTSVRIPIITLLEQHAALRRRTIRTAIQHVKGNLKRITLQHIDAVMRLCLEGSSGQQLHLPDRLTIQRQAHDQLLVTRQTAPDTSRANSHTTVTTPFDTIPIPYPAAGSQTVVVKEFGLSFLLETMSEKSVPGLTHTGHKTAYFDMDKLTFPLLLRNILPGDRFKPLGMRGTQKIKNFFINNKIPREIRRKTPVLVNGEAIVWIVGYRIDERAKITQQTRNVLKIELLLA